MDCGHVHINRISFGKKKQKSIVHIFLYRGTPRSAYLKYDLWGKKIIIKNSLRHLHLLGSSCQDNRNGTEKVGGTKSHLPGHSPPASQAGRRVGAAI